ncbi:hypothetical protein PIB30_073113 [Stylosanthes scabra]|uniref:Uncharacterized protein n=1 Tax=Stylosanthes scabra TaxID=79078 RepID=A0ABU6WML7_9FABA|nr:hypothetical protein [Stylosanthes scabra]
MAVPQRQDQAENGRREAAHQPQGPYGEWMAVQRPRRGKKVQKNKETNKTNGQKNEGSTFTALQETKGDMPNGNHTMGNQKAEINPQNGVNNNVGCTFLSGSAMRKESGKGKIESQNTITHVMETPAEKIRGARLGTSTSKDSSAPKDNQRNLPIIGTGPTEIDVIDSIEVEIEENMKGVVEQEAQPNPKPPDLDMELLDHIVVDSPMGCPYGERDRMHGVESDQPNVSNQNILRQSEEHNQMMGNEDDGMCIDLHKEESAMEN